MESSILQDTFMSSVHPINFSTLQSTVCCRTLTSLGQWNVNDEENAEGKRFHMAVKSQLKGE